ncbi:MAG TPA: 1,4-alpha-glucan branching protein domain-containing protein [Symbiobacteriaceae bacterium]
MPAEFALVLHAHLPYIRPSGREILEERWLYEAVAESYLPLVWALERLQNDTIPARVTISLSGPLLSMLADRGLMARCRTHLAHRLELAEREAAKAQGGPFAAAATYHRYRFKALVDDLDFRGGDLLAAFRSLQDAGVVELITAAGTHACLPLLGSDAARAAHLEAAAAEYARHFGQRPAGVWLPECAYAPGLDHLLAAAGLGWFVAEASTVAAAYPPVDGAVVLTPAGVAAFARDTAASRQVWDRKSGYPGDPAYREFYKDVGYELPLAEVAPWLVEGIRGDTGLKYYRITGAGLDLGAKQPYDPETALDRTQEHARHFARLLQDRSGLVVAPFDAELFGHWWFEGPLWIEALYRELAAGAGAGAGAGGVRPVTPSEWLGAHSDLPIARLPAGSWGDGGDYRVWVSADNDWLWPQVHDAERRMLALIDRGDISQAALDQMARELLLAEASDWPFILYFHTATEYAKGRVRRHLDRFRSLAAGRAIPSRYQGEDGIFPGLNARTLFRKRPPVPAAGPLRVLMLAWEFPPNHVGGLGVHVHDLGAALAAAGHRVHVVTVADGPNGAPGTSKTKGMTVHRVARPPEEGNFLAWTYRLNQSMVAAALKLADAHGPFDVVHSHDWLVGQAGMALKARWGSEFIATIHATEKGRNGTIREPIQQAIHDEEWLLTTAADRVITVSQAMAREVSESFRVTPTVIYNGVDLPDATPAGPPPQPLDAPYFFYIGRLVPEKGVQVAIEALSRMESRAHLVVAGRGPMEGELKRLATQRGVAGRVHLVGRVSDREKDAWLHYAAAGLVPSLYEPFGIVALEVMAAGVPAVVGDTGGLAEIVTSGVDGIKVPPGDAGALATAMDWLLFHPEQARGLGWAGRDRAAGRFGWPAIAAETVAVYRGPAAIPALAEVAAARQD